MKLQWCCKLVKYNCALLAGFWLICSPPLTLSICFCSQQQGSRPRWEREAKGHLDNVEWIAGSLSFCLFHPPSENTPLEALNYCECISSSAYFQSIDEKIDINTDWMPNSLHIQLPLSGQAGYALSLWWILATWYWKGMYIPLRIYTFPNPCRCQIVKLQEVHYQRPRDHMNRCIPVDYILTCRSESSNNTLLWHAVHNSCWFLIQLELKIGPSWSCFCDAKDRGSNS